MLSSWSVGTASAAVISPAGVLEVHDDGQRQMWASVTKVVTALTVLDACVEGAIGLDSPAGPPGATVRHLLAHASGLSPQTDAVLAAPGARRIYSNRGMEVLAEALTRITGRPFMDEVAHRVTGPLGMDRFELTGSPAYAGVGTLTDLVRLAAELLAPRALLPGVVTAASTLAFPGLNGVLPGYGRQKPNDWGLGCEIKSTKDPHWTAPGNSPRTFGHFGQSGSFLWVDPDAELACVSLTDTPFGPWAVDVWPRLATAVLVSYGTAEP